MDDDQQFCLRWNNHQSTLISVFDTLLENGTLVDCTLAAEGKFLKAHKVVLSACSPYFATLLSQQYDKHPIFILKDVKFQELRAMMDYMYRGEVNISQDQLAALLKAAESLQIKGLSDSRSGGNSIGGGGSGVGPKSAAEHKPLSVPVASAAMKGASPSGFTIEQKRPRHTIGGPSSIESQSGSREGSSSPTSRKRKKMRRRSIDNINADNHEHSNSSSQSMKINSSVPQSNTSATAITSVQSAVVSATQQQQQQAAIGGSGGGAAAAAGSGLNVTKKTDSISSNTKLETTGTEHDLDTENGNEHDDNIGKSINARKEQNHKRKQHAADVDDGKDGGEILIEPKSEYEEGNDETVEDLTLDDEELLEDLDQAGPSHGGGEGSSQGYAQWQVDRSQDDVFMATQEAAGQQRDPQGEGLHKRLKPPPSPDDQPCDLRLITSATIKELVAAATSSASCSIPSKIPPPLPALATAVSGPTESSVAAAVVAQAANVASNYANIVAAVAAAATSPVSKLSTCLTPTIPQQIQQHQSLQQQSSSMSSSSQGAGGSGPHRSPLQSVKFCPPIGLEGMQAITVSMPPSGGLSGTTASLTSPLLNLQINSGSSSTSSSLAAGSSGSSIAVPGGSGGGTGSGGGWGAFTCPRCGNSYARPHSLNRHIRFECGVEPKFECPICHKKSKHKHNLVLHMRTHQNR